MRIHRVITAAAFVIAIMAPGAASAFEMTQIGGTNSDGSAAVSGSRGTEAAGAARKRAGHARQRLQRQRAACRAGLVGSAIERLFRLALRGTADTPPLTSDARDATSPRHTTRGIRRTSLVYSRSSTTTASPPPLMRCDSAASMNGSISPSRTSSGFVDCAPVRRSFTS